ncbi:tetratricopeptide repeat protein [Streptomyces sp. NPDC093085]|uniref:tetratricopeptide repeat protein n=1 Tax=Streptomyces sp. NPDC093085 TaxID=3155068 RepID=UPI00343248F1
MLDPMSMAAIVAVLGAVGTATANEAVKSAWEVAGGLIQRITGRAVPAPRGSAERDAVARLVHEAVRDDPALARTWAAFARTAPLPGRADAVPVLPPSIRHFRDRQGPMKTLGREATRKADGRPRIALVHGPEGIGTSALAVHWGCMKADLFPDGQLYADLRGASAGTALDSAVVLRSLLVQLGMDADDIPLGAADRRDVFQRCVAGRKLLVVLDHAHSAAQVLPLLTSAPEVFTVVVARRPLRGLDAVPVPVGPLSDKDALHLLTDLAGRETVDAARAVLPRVLERCGGSPYALRAAAPLLADPTTPPFAAPSGGGSEEAPIPPGHDPVRTAAEETYRRLEPGAARVYRLMSLREWPSFGADTVAPVAGIPVAEAARALGALADAELLEVVSGMGRYRYRPVIRGHAEETAFRTDGIAACSAALTSTVRWYLEFAVRARVAALPRAWALGPLYGRLKEELEREGRIAPYGDEGEALTALRTELGGIVQAVLAAEELGDPDAVYQLCQALWPLQLKAGHHDEILPALRAGARVADARHPGSQWAGRMHTLLALNLMELREEEAAESELTLAAQAEETAGHLLGQASAVETLGLLRLRQWDGTEAYACFDRAGALLDGIGPDDEGAGDLPRARALLQRHRGRALRVGGDYTGARERLESALASFRRGGEAYDPYNAARTLTDLAETCLLQDEPQRALALIDEAEATLDKEKAAQHLTHLRGLRERCLSAQAGG